MKCLKRNRIKVYYALYHGKDPVFDENGHRTGEYRIVYTRPKALFANVSAIKGESQTMQFGANIEYDRVMLLDEDSPRLDEHSVLWVDVDPELSEDGTAPIPPDYIIKRVARSLNHVSVSISKVNTSD